MVPRADLKVISLEDVADMVPDGSSVFIGGFTLHRVPVALVLALARARKKDFTVWSHIGGVGIELLMAADAVRHVRSSYAGLDIVGFAPVFTSRVSAGEVAYTEETEATMMFGMKATQYRLPFMPSRALVGSEIVRTRDDLQEYTCQISGERLVTIPPVEADVAFLHARRADRRGNVQFNGTMGNDVEIAKVSRRVIVSVEEVVESSDLMESSDLTCLPEYLVDAVVEVRGGAAPTSMVPDYGVDYGFFLDYVAAVGDMSPAEFVAWADERLGGIHQDGDVTT